jgi:hypothetical protein
LTVPDDAYYPEGQERWKDALTGQVGGSHYKDMDIQPIEIFKAMGILEEACVANVIKYIMRYKKKGGKQDLEKVKHYVEILLASLEP